MTDIYEAATYWEAMEKAGKALKEPVSSLSFEKTEAEDKGSCAVKVVEVDDGVPSHQKEMEEIVSLLEELIKAQGWDLKTEATIEENKFCFNLKGNSGDELLGEKDFLNDLDYVINIFRKAQFAKSPYEFSLDINSYRTNKEKELIEITTKACEQVMEEKAEYTLAAMNAYDRRVVHLTINQFPEIESVSRGEGKKKEIIIRFKGAPGPAKPVTLKKNDEKISDF